VLRSRGDGDFEGHKAFSVLPGPIAVVVGDLNGDTAGDIVVGCAVGAGGLSVLLSDP